MQPINPAIPSDTRVIVSNTIASGAAFAARLDNGDNCYIPVSVSQSVEARIGDELIAKIVPNRYPDKTSKTPWLVIHLVRPAQAALPITAPVQFARPTRSVFERVSSVMKKGGVWTVAAMFEELFPDDTRAGNIQDYNAVSTALRKMFDDGHCAKFSMWASVSQTKASREWFTCHPDRADVDEWDE